LAIQKLTDLVDVRTVDHLDGTKTVYVGSHTLVDQFGSYDLPSQYDANSSTVTDGTKVIQIKGGRLAGEFGGIVALGNYQTQLDSLVNSVRTQINLLHETGINLNGTTGIDFFAGSVGAGDLDLSQEIKDDIRNIAAGTSGEPGDGTLASSIAGVRDLPDPNLGNRSVMDYYANTISQLGQESAYYQNGLQTQQAMLSQIDQQRQSVMGVNMDEELANMLKYQRSYQAAARFLTVLDQTTEDLISQFGR
jgi:flagellar hook-associated protein 1 FlgK